MKLYLRKEVFLNERAFFLMDDLLLLPVDFPELNPDDPQAGELPVELAKDFTNPEIFEIQALYPEGNAETGSVESSAKITVVSAARENNLPKNWRSISVRQALAVIKSDNIGRMLRSCHIVRWRKESRFCGTCGSENMEPLNNLQRTCPNCGRLEFPRICPAVITIITDEQNRILLAHNKNFRAGLYSLISGFTEAGESLEETVVREIHEEVNIKVKDIVYIKSQPWPFPNSLMLGFKARYLSGTLKPDGIEIEDARWFTKDNLPELPGEGSLSRLLINNWLNGTF